MNMIDMIELTEVTEVAAEEIDGGMDLVGWVRSIGSALGSFYGAQGCPGAGGDVIWCNLGA